MFTFLFFLGIMNVELGYSNAVLKVLPIYLREAIIYFKRVKWKMIYCCEEHVEIGLDTIVDEYGTFPLLTKIDVDNLPTNCEYCQNPAIYVVGNK